MQHNQHVVAWREFSLRQFCRTLAIAEMIVKHTGEPAFEAWYAKQAF